MKKTAALLTALALILGLCACSSAQPENPSEESSPSSTQSPTWQEQYDLGVRYLSEGNYQDAIIAFTAAIEIDPRQADAYIGLADTYEAQGDVERARHVLEDALAAVADPEAIQNRLVEMGESANLESTPGTTIEPTQELEPTPEATAEPSLAPSAEPTVELTPESPPITFADFAYAGDIDGSVWHFYDDSPNSSSSYIGRFNFSESGDVHFLCGWAYSEISGVYSGNYNLRDSNVLYLELTDDEADSSISVTYKYDVAIIDSENFLLTQISETGLFYYHEVGHQITLTKGVF